MGYISKCVGKDCGAEYFQSDYEEPRKQCLKCAEDKPQKRKRRTVSLIGAKGELVTRRVRGGAK